MVKALVLFHSQVHGNTAALAQAISAGLKEAGCEVDIHNTNDARFDINHFAAYDCVAFGSPDYFGYVAGGMKMFIDDHFAAVRFQNKEGMQGKPYILFYTHGRGGMIKDVIGRLFTGVGNLVGRPVGCQGKPTADILDHARQLGLQLARSVS